MFKILTLPKRLLSWVHKHKWLAYPLYALLLFTLYIVVLIQMSGDGHYYKTLESHYINDVTKLNPVHVEKIIRPTKTEEIKEAIVSTVGPISIGGGKFSMGGQTAFAESLHIDMRSFNKVLSLNKDAKEVTVQAGITWRDLQEAVDKKDLSVKIMQTYANFTVGGSISVNCHGRYIGFGPIVSSVKSMKIMLASGETMRVSRTENFAVFKAVVGGYGGIAVILEATLELAENIKVERQTKLVDVKNYRTFFTRDIRDNKDIVFQNGDLYPPHYDQVMNVSWKKSSKPLTNEEHITSRDEGYWLERKAVTLVSYGDTGKWIRRNIIDPYLYSSEAVVWRNKEASYDVKELEPSSRDETTYVLNEYFIPVENFESFISKMKAIYEKYDVNILNVSLRHALKNDESYLSWARGEVFAFVVYYKQGTSKEAQDEVKVWTQEVSDAIISENGTWYLPYQPHASMTQFKKAYPDSQMYFDVKKQLDPDNRFTNQLLDKYNVNVKKSVEKEIKGYKRSEEQTVLTVPEWYLVFNPKEYADYLEAGKNPSDFPLYASIDEYWKLYDRSVMLTKNYPKNDEYMTMLQVIGVSMTIEYGFKMVYENTLGKLFSLFSEKAHSTKEDVINQAHRAYSDFVYHTAFYEFGFWSWVKKVWASTEEKEEYSTLRKWERTLFFTLEFSFKAFYSQLLTSATKATYEEPVKNIYVWVNSTVEIKETKDLQIVKQSGNRYLLAITRWGAFTKTLLKLPANTMQIESIAGNENIAVSVLMPKEKFLDETYVNHLYNSTVVTDSHLKREVNLMPVNKVLAYIAQCQKHGIEVEHVFDY